MKVLTIVGIALLGGLPGFSQENDEVRISAGHSVNEYFPPSRRFRYDYFQDGTIHYDLGNGKMSIAGKLNYDLVNGEVLLIKIKEDTVPMVDHKIGYFKIGSDVFLNLPDGVFEVIPGAGEIKLCVNSKYILKRTERISSTGLTSGYDATASNAMENRNPTAITSNPIIQNVILKKSIKYCISTDGNTRTFKATRSKILKNFTNNKKREIAEFVDVNKTNFTRRTDLDRLVDFLNSIY